MKILDLGCGKRKQKSAIGIDIFKDTDADIVHDLNKFPYPFSDNEFDYIYADNIIEHLDDVVRKSFLYLFGKSVQTFSCLDEGVEKIRTFLDSDPEEFTVRIPRSEKSIFETLKGEFNALKSEKYN